MLLIGIAPKPEYDVNSETCFFSPPYKIFCTIFTGISCPTDTPVVLF